MSASGWNLAARLVTKHFSVLGDKVSETIAAFDPETATEADRDRLADILRETAVKLAQARSAYSKEHQDVVALQELIANDTNALKTLSERLAAGTISEGSVKVFLDELEANKGKLPQEQQEEADAKEYMDQLQQIVDGYSQQLEQFDEKAKKAKMALANAQSQIQLQELRQQRQSEVEALKGIQSNSSALNALTKKAAQLQSQAEGMKIVTDINQKPIDQAEEIEKIRASVKNGDANESTAERMKRLMGAA